MRYVLEWEFNAFTIYPCNQLINECLSRAYQIQDRLHLPESYCFVPSCIFVMVLRVAKMNYCFDPTQKWVANFFDALLCKIETGIGPCVVRCRLEILVY